MELASFDAAGEREPLRGLDDQRRPVRVLGIPHRNHTRQIPRNLDAGPAIGVIETGQRDLTRISDLLALAGALSISPRYLADGRHDAAPAGQPRPAPAVPFPARTGPRTLARHHHLARQSSQLTQQDTRAAGDWLRRLARNPTISPWLLLDQLAAVPGGPPPRLITPHARANGSHRDLSPQMRARTVPTATCHPECTGELGLKRQITTHPG